jgi:hypothetical protein
VFELPHDIASPLLIPNESHLIWMLRNLLYLFCLYQQAQLKSCQPQATKYRCREDRIPQIFMLSAGPEMQPKRYLISRSAHTLHSQLVAVVVSPSSDAFEY